jgi:hypothetical protein
MNDETDPVFLSSLRVGADAFAALHPVIDRDAEGARVLRSVLMKPEHEHSAGWLAERIEMLVDAVAHGSDDPASTLREGVTFLKGQETVARTPASRARRRARIGTRLAGVQVGTPACHLTLRPYSPECVEG